MLAAAFALTLFAQDPAQPPGARARRLHPPGRRMTWEGPRP